MLSIEINIFPGVYFSEKQIERRTTMKTFKEELELILRRYIPFTGDKDYYDSVVKLVSIKVEELHERYKDK